VGSARRRLDQAHHRLTARRAVSGPVDVVVKIYERDRASFGSVLGSAVAF